MAQNEVRNAAGWRSLGLLDEKDPLLVSLLDNAKLYRLQQGQKMLREGQSCDTVPFVISGSLRVYKSSENGKEITLYRIEPGQTCLLSSTCLDRGVRFPANAVADADTAYLGVHHEAFGKLMDGASSWRRLVMTQFQSRLTEVLELVNEVAFRHMDERLASLLLKTADSGAISSTHQEMADSLGTSREVVTRILRDFEDTGLIRTGRGTVEILNPAGLTERARIGWRA